MSNVNTENFVNALNSKKKLIQKRKDAIVGAKSQLEVYEKNDVEYTEQLKELGVSDVSENGIENALKALDTTIEQQVAKLNALFQDLNNV